MTLSTCCLLALSTAWAALPAQEVVEPADSPAPQQSLLIVVGAAGEPQYETLFSAWARELQQAVATTSVHCQVIGRSTENGDSDLTRLLKTLATEVKQHPEPLWIVLLGHGTYDGREAKFNLRGPDLSAGRLKEALSPFERTVVVVNCASASSPFLNAISGENRIIVTATKSGYQYNFARWGGFFAEAVGNGQADLDKDGQTSLLEAFLNASARVEEYYRQEARLATEHALLDDNSDGRGTPADWFRGVRAIKRPQENVEVDGSRAHQLHLVRSEQEEQLTQAQRRQRDELESQVITLRRAKADMEETQYYEQLLTLMTRLARIYESGEN